MPFIGMLLFALAPTSKTGAQTATITTDQTDYPPGSTVYITGSGFQPNETVTLQVLHYDVNGDNDTSSVHQPWTVMADADGNVSSTWLVPLDQDELGATLLLTADQAATDTHTAIHAETTFTDNATLTIGGTPAPISVSKSADNAQNGASPNFTTIGNIVVKEGNGVGNRNDFATSFNKITLTAPSGWQFRTTPGSVTVSKTGADVTLGAINLGTSTITIGVTIGGTASNDDITISGVGITSTNGAVLPNAGNITFGYTGSIGGLSSPVNIVSLTQVVGAASQIAINAGDNQTATAGTAVATDPSVIVKDAFGNPVSGVSVAFAVASGGGSGTGLTPTTNSSGIATITSWTLGPTAGSNTLTATKAGLTGSPITFNATGVAGAAAKIAINAGNSQTATVGTAVAISPSVIVKDANDNVVSGVSITFVVATGGGSGTGLTTTTNASGIATVGSWTLGNTAGSNTMTVTKGGLTGSPITFSATGVAGAATQIAINAGNNQTATVGTAVATAPSVTVNDAFGNPVSGVTVTFAVGSGGGSATGLITNTNSSGIATVGSWTLGTIAGANTLTATSTGLTGSPVTFNATGTAGNVDHFVFNTISSPQTAGITFLITITAQDVNNNTATSFTGGSNKVMVSANGGILTVGGAVATPAFTSGVLSNYSVAISPGALGVTLTATRNPSGPQTGTSNAFDVINPCTAPIVTVPSSPVLANTASGVCNAAVTYPTSVSGTSPTVTYTFSGVTTGSGSGDGSGSIFNKGNTTVTVSASNGCGSDSKSFTVTVSDDQEPVLSTALPGGAQGNVCKSAAPGAPSEASIASHYNDNCGTVIATLTNSSVTGSNCSWTAQYTYSIQDADGNFTSDAVVTYTGGDTEAPSLGTNTIPAGGSNMNLCFSAIPAGPSESDIAALYTDNCGTVHVTKTGTPTGTSCSWTVTYHYTIKDDCNNYATPVDITYSGGDTEAPVITACTQDKSVAPNNGTSTTDQCSYKVSGTSWDVTATDNCGTPTVAYMLSGATNKGPYSTLNGVVFNLGVTYVSAVATDGCSHTSVPCNFKVTVTSTLSASASTNNPVLYFGYNADQTATITGTASGGTGPYTIKIAMSRSLLCNQVTSAGDEIWAPGANTLNSAGVSTCPLSGTPAIGSEPSSTSTAVSSSYSVNVTLMADAVFTITVTDAHGCTATTTITESGEDVRCFAGNSGVAKVTLCHKTGSAKNPIVTICVDQDAVADHLAHGDCYGACPKNATTCTQPSGAIAQRLDLPDGKLQVNVMPNPTERGTAFNLVVTGKANEEVELRVLNVIGKEVYTTRGAANQTYKFGANFISGVYFVEVMQGGNKQIIKIMKQ